MSEKVLPALRKDISGEIYEEDGREYVFLHDPLSYASQSVTIPIEFLPFFKFLDGLSSIETIRHKIMDDVQDITNEEIEELIGSFLDLVKFLDYLGYLDSPRFRWMKQDLDNYLSSTIRPAYCAGSSYPSKADEIRKEFDLMFSTVSSDSIKDSAEMIIAPHIDFRIGEASAKTYASCYYALRNIQPELIVIIGTSHYGSNKPLIFTEKHFETPLGTAVNATDILMNLIEDKTLTNITIDEISHRYEHSIEFQVLLSQYFFRNKTFKILPILVNGFSVDDNSFSAEEQKESLIETIQKIKVIIEGTGLKTVYIVSADLSHVGMKFGDDFDALEYKEAVYDYDSKLLRHITNGDSDEFYHSIVRVNDKNRICGFAPIYFAMKLKSYKDRGLLHYDFWYEKETKSAVSFAGVAFY